VYSAINENGEKIVYLPSDEEELEDDTPEGS
jgi:hypothetical protein